MRHFILTALYIALSQILFAQTYPFIGSRANGLAYASACLSDEWSVFNNPAGLSGVDHTSVSTTYDMVPGFKTFSRYAAVAALPVGSGGAGVGIFRFGDDLFRQQVFALSYANKLGIASLGATVQYIQFTAEGFGSKGVATFSLGGITELTSWLKVGAHIINLTQPEIAEQEKIATTLLMGVSVKASENVFVFVETEKTINETPLVKAGVEYKFHEKFVARTGFHPAPSAAFFGFGFHPKRIQFDYAFSYIPNIGMHHQASFCYLFKKRA